MLQKAIGMLTIGLVFCALVTLSISIRLLWQAELLPPVLIVSMAMTVILADLLFAVVLIEMVRTTHVSPKRSPRRMVVATKTAPRVRNPKQG